MSALEQRSGVEDRQEDQDANREDCNAHRPADEAVKGLFLSGCVHRTVLVFSHLRHPLQMFSSRYPICLTVSPMPIAQCVALHILFQFCRKLKPNAARFDIVSQNRHCPQRDVEL